MRLGENRIWLYTTRMETGRRKEVLRDEVCSGEEMNTVKSELAELLARWF